MPIVAQHDCSNKEKHNVYRASQDILVTVAGCGNFSLFVQELIDQAMFLLFAVACIPLLQR